MTHGAETLTRASENKHKIDQRAVERSMLGIRLRDEMINQWIRQQKRNIILRRVVKTSIEMQSEISNGMYMPKCAGNDLDKTIKFYSL